MEGNSVMAFIHGFNSYFYVPTFDGFSQADLTLFADSLNVLHAYPLCIVHIRNFVTKVDSASTPLTDFFVCRMR
jgi:hypothetical protein